MTIRLLSTRGGFDAGSIIDLDPATEAGLVLAKMASFDLTGGVRRFRAVSAPGNAPVLTGPQNVSIDSGEQVTVTVPPGYRLVVSGNAGAQGTAELLSNGSDKVDRAQAISAGPNQVGPFATERRVRLSSASGVFAAIGSNNRREPSAARSIMFLGSSSLAAGSALPNLPKNEGVQIAAPSLTAFNAQGQFIGKTFIERGDANLAAGGVLRFRVADSTLSWQAPGDMEGPRVRVSVDHLWYTLESGTPGKRMFLETLPRLAPLVDVTETVPAPINNLWRYDNVSTYGLPGWIQLLAGRPFARTVSYAKSSAAARDIRAAHADWEDDYTDITVVYIGNEIATRAGARNSLEDIEVIARLRTDIGSRLIVGCALPQTGRSAADIQAVAEYNALLQQMGERLGFRVFDAAPWVAGRDGDWLAGFSYDGTHMGPLTTMTVAKYAALPQMTEFAIAPLPGSPSLVPYDAVTAPYGNLLANGVLAGIGGSKGGRVTGTVPDGHTVESSGGTTISQNCIAPDSAGATPLSNGRAGNYFTIEINNSNAGAVNGEKSIFRRASNLTMPLVPGDLVIFEGEFRIRGTGIQYLSVTMVESTSTRSTTTFVMHGSAATGSGLKNLNGDTLTIPFRTSEPYRVSPGFVTFQIFIETTMLAGGTAVLEIAPTLNLHPVPA